MMRRIIQTILLLTTITASAQKTVQNQDSIQSQDSITWDKTLDEVVITSQRQLVKSDPDKLTYDIQGDEESKTKTIIEMLKKVPMVTVDGEDNIRVNGSSEFKIYKNGHLDPSMSKNPKEVLKSIPASMVKKIEVITEPGAKYDAEGTAGRSLVELQVLYLRVFPMWVISMVKVIS